MTEPLVIGRYALFDELASGGMATVHLGRLLGPAGFGRTVAIKRLHKHFLAEPEFISMFTDEARIVARIVHPNVVPMFDVVQSDEGLFLVMEYVHGETLSRLMRHARNNKEAIPPRIACGILHSVLLGLHAAHETKDQNGVLLDVVHRDVSPQNVIVGADGVARVLDFGIAKAAGRVQVTREGQLKGKLAYMAPEQIRGKADRRTDVFAAGVMLWEMLAGRRLHDGLKDVEIVTRVIDGTFTPPSDFAPGLPQVLDALVMRALAVEPDDRYPTAQDMAIELERNVGLASPNEIATWVQRFGKPSLDARAAKIAAIEQAAGKLTTHNGSVVVAPAAPAPEPAPPPPPRFDPALHSVPGPQSSSGVHGAPPQSAQMTWTGAYTQSYGGQATSSSLFAHSQTQNSVLQGPKLALGLILFGISIFLGIIGLGLGTYSIMYRRAVAQRIEERRELDRMRQSQDVLPPESLSTLPARADAGAPSAPSTGSPR